MASEYLDFRLSTWAGVARRKITRREPSFRRRAVAQIERLSNENHRLRLVLKQSEENLAQAREEIQAAQHRISRLSQAILAAAEESDVTPSLPALTGNTTNTQ